jgi:SpoVK/Ycf46/Vps4 family AAA+-type ATPase
VARPKKYKTYEDFLVDISDYFSALNFASYLFSLTPGEIIKDRKRISLLVSQDVSSENIKKIAELKRLDAVCLYDAISSKIRSSKLLPPARLMNDFKLSELEMLIILYLSWQEMMTDQVFIYTRTITHMLKMLIGSDKEALSKLKYFGSDSTLMQSGLVYLDRHNNSPIGSSDIIVIDEVQEILMNMAEYDADRIRKKRIKNGVTTSQASSSDFSISEPSDVKLILPEATMQQLHMVETYINHKDKIMKEWGLADSITYGSAMALLFHGPPGTGKTLSAKYLASVTGKRLIVADYAEIMNKYVGETEKKIKGLFAKARSTDSILLIDEVDSLVYGRKDDSRSWEVSHVNTTLQAIESFDGIVIFTTNRDDLLDKALERRILIKVHFLEPDEVQREMIWQSMFSNPDSLGEDVDFTILAKKFAYAGGHIKNAALMAALKAAEREHDQIMQEDLLDAAQLEFTKLKIKNRLGFEVPSIGGRI